MFQSVGASTRGFTRQECSVACVVIEVVTLSSAGTSTATQPHRSLGARTLCCNSGGILPVCPCHQSWRLPWCGQQLQHMAPGTDCWGKSCRQSFWNLTYFRWLHGTPDTKGKKNNMHVFTGKLTEPRGQRALTISADTPGNRLMS